MIEHLKQPLSVTLIFPLSPCIIVIDTFAETNLITAYDGHVSTDHGGKANPIRM